MELWDGYNAKEEKVGIDIIRGEKINKGILHAVVNVVVYNNDGTYLLMQRDWNKPNKPGLWEAGASGSVVKGEEFLEAALRELYEETGIKVNDLEFVDTIVKAEKNTFYKLYLCRCKVDKDSIILQEEETIDYKWVQKEEFINIMNSDEFVTPDFNKLYKLVENIGVVVNEAEENNSRNK